jgi:hypothetical protein
LGAADFVDTLDKQRDNLTAQAQALAMDELVADHVVPMKISPPSTPRAWRCFAPTVFDARLSPAVYQFRPV